MCLGFPDLIEKIALISLVFFSTCLFNTITILMHGKICKLNCSVTVVGWFVFFLMQTGCLSIWRVRCLPATVKIFNLSSSFSSLIHFQMDTQTKRQEDLHLLKWEYLGLYGKRV